MTEKRVLSVGQCGADHGSLARTFRKNFGVEIDAADTHNEALARLRAEPFALVLVNRVLDADGASGVELIRKIKGDPSLRDVPVMLVSNYEDAQSEAVAVGAAPGFGKAALGSPATIERIRAVLR